MGVSERWKAAAKNRWLMTSGASYEVIVRYLLPLSSQLGQVGAEAP